MFMTWLILSPWKQKLWPGGIKRYLEGSRYEAVIDVKTGRNVGHTVPQKLTGKEDVTFPFVYGALRKMPKLRFAKGIMLLPKSL